MRVRCLRAALARALLAFGNPAFSQAAADTKSEEAGADGSIADHELSTFGGTARDDSVVLRLQVDF
ncbi:MAG: hypothetical protein JXQ29_04415 [Planctomycetes bacterium]|nr:hypothetical protein [Planctomycetota bacterium]